MINAESHPVEWAALLYELDDARDHLAKLLEQMKGDGQVDEVDFGVQLGHIYSHLNRAWNGRRNQAEPSTAEWEAQSEFPTDLRPV